MAYTILRTKKNDQVAFRGQCKHHPKEPVGICSARLSSSGTANHLDIINVDLTEEQGSDYHIIYDVSYTKWRTREWNDDKSALETAVSYASPALAIAGLNNVLQFQDSDAVTEGSIPGISTTGTSFFNQINASGIITAAYFYGDGAAVTNTVGIQSGGTVIGNTRTLNFIGAGNTVTVNGSKIDVSIAGGGGGTGIGTTGSINTSGIVTATSFHGDGSNIIGISTNFVSAVGIQSAGTVIGAGITQLNFIGTGNTFAVNGTTVDVSISGGGGSGNPVTSGIFTGSSLVLTLDDSSTVTIDATLAITSPAVTIDLPNWYQQYLSPGAGFTTSGPQVSTMTITQANNPFYYGEVLRKGEEYIWTHSNSASGSQKIGIWDGDVTYNPDYASHNNRWTRAIRILTGSVTRAYNDAYATVGFDLTSDYDPLTNNVSSLALRYDNTTSKLQLWDRTNEVWNMITEADTAEDGNPVTISVSGATNVPIPDWTKREYDWEIIAQVTEGAQTTWRGVSQLHDTVLRKTRGLCKSWKMVLTTPAAWNNQYLGFDYTGSALGQTAVESQNTSVLQCTSAEKIIDKGGWTIVSSAQRYGSGSTTAAMGGGKISFRYHTDNKVDLYDEDNEEILFTKDSDADGNPIYLHHYNSTDVTWNYDLLQNWTFEPFDQNFFVHPLQEEGGTLVTHSSLTNYSGRAQWGELFYPGQELKWQNNATEDLYFGNRNALNTAWIQKIKLSASGNGDIDVSDCEGFDISGSDVEFTSHTMSLKYDYGDKKLKLYNENNVGISTLITTSIDAIANGDPIKFTISGDDAVLPVITHRYYGWEYIHTSNYPQLWRNWRCNRPSANNQIRTDTVLRSLRALIPGWYMRWQTPSSATSIFFGKWKASNAATGLNNVDTNEDRWDWGFRWNSSEQTINLNLMSFNTSNSNYNAGGPTWNDPDKGTTIVGIRYNSNNSVDLYDFTNSAVIATKDSNLDGSPFYLDVGNGTNLSDITDNFLGGGDVDFGTI